MSKYDKTIFIAIAFGTSVRDVLRNDTYRSLQKQKNIRIVVLAPQVNDPEFIEEFKSDNVEFELLEKYHATRISSSIIET